MKNLLATGSSDRIGSEVAQSTIMLKDLPPPPDGRRGWPWTVGTRPMQPLQSDGSPWPKLSIVTPSYNQGAFLEATIRSVLLQGYPNLEYMIIDGGSSDESVAIIQKYEQFLAYWVSEPDDGQTAAINQGLVRSTGDYLAWLNSDDLYTKGAFEKAIKAFINYPESIVVHGNRILIDGQDQVFGCSPLPEFNPLETGFIVCSETAFWTRSGMELHGRLNSDLQFAMDLEFFSRLFLQGPFTKLDDYLGYFRCHGASKSSTIWHVAKEESSKVWPKLFQAEWSEKKIEVGRIRILREFCKHPLMLGIPYLKTKLISQFSKPLDVH